MSMSNNDKQIVADITKRILLGESFGDIFVNMYDDINYLRILIGKFHADPNEEDRNGHLALYYAINRNYYDIVKYLLDHGANPNLKSTYGCIAFRFVHTKQMEDILKQYD